MSLTQLQQDLQKLKNPEKAGHSQHFFKTGKGQYAEGDIFLGISTHPQRKLAKKYIDLNLVDIKKLLHTKIHEYRFVALIILTYQFEKLYKQINILSKSPKKSVIPEPTKNRHRESIQIEKQLKQIYNFYLSNTKWINNWDLIDVTTPKIIGQYLLTKKSKARKILYKLARSNNLWERRISIMATFPFIKTKDFQDTLQISQILLLDEHDLIHKAVGWMLREIGKIDQKVEENFLMEHSRQMPRTMLRYAIEKFPEPKRQFYLKKYK